MDCESAPRDVRSYTLVVRDLAVRAPKSDRESKLPSLAALLLTGMRRRKLKSRARSRYTAKPEKKSHSWASAVEAAVQNLIQGSMVIARIA